MCIRSQNFAHGFIILVEVTHGALSGIRVLDLSRVLAGPWAGQILADMGAEVIKVERPDTGDDTRGWGPPFLRDREGKETSEAAYYLSTNRGKQSVTVDLSTIEGQDIIRRLATVSDVLIENFKVGDIARYGLSYDDLKKLNPRLIYCSISGFGQDGPKAHLPSYDFTIQGIGGLMSITGERDVLLGGGPQKAGIAVSDLSAGMFATVAILGALMHRNDSGKGQYIDISLLDCMVASIAGLNMNYLTSGEIPGRQGNAHQNIVPYQVFDALDAQFVLAVGNDGQFARLSCVLGVPELADNDRYAQNAERVKNRDSLIPMLQAIFRTKPAGKWIELLEEQRIPSGPVNNIAQAFENPQVRHREMCIGLPHPMSGTIPLVANPIKFSETPIRYVKAPPTLSQHTRRVLTRLVGLSDGEFQALADKGIV